MEDYKNVNPNREGRRVQQLNQTSQLPVGGRPLDMIRSLTRGFHLNTIVNRLFTPWTVGFEHAPIRGNYTMSKKRPDLAYRYRAGQKDPTANDKFKAAYALFKQEIANAIAALPYKEGFDVKRQETRDVLAPTKAFLADVTANPHKGLIESMRSAFNIFWKVFGKNYSNHIRDYVNFFQIVHDEFMRVSEKLPTMGDDEGDDLANIPIVGQIEEEIRRYQRIEHRLNPEIVDSF